MTVAETRTIAAGDGDEIVVETIRAMAAAKDVDHTALDTVLADVLDPDALTQLFTTDARIPPHGVSVTVTIDGYHVTLRMHDASEVTIEVTTPTEQPTASDHTSPSDAQPTTDVES